GYRCQLLAERRTYFCMPKSACWASTSCRSLAFSESESVAEVGAWLLAFLRLVGIVAHGHGVGESASQVPRPTTVWLPP
ncbi:MAG: hypothetical protein IJV20_08175, partial [Prevotella sp.]|nr:hypothetical protein [Prevotella sp.]